MSISVVVPVFNSESLLSELAERLKLILKDLRQEHELILVNDGSTDQSWDVIDKLVKKYKWIRGINLMRNYGQHNALLCGIRVARYDITVTMDDDLQHPPEEIPKLLDRLTECVDVVYGTPQKERHGFWRSIASRITKLALKSTMNIKIARNVSAFRAFRTKVRDAFANYQGPFVSIDVLLTWGTIRFAAVRVRHDTRRIGASHYTFKKLVIHSFNMITGFSTLPLQLASLVGFVVMLFGVGALFYVVISYLIHGGNVPGFSFLACIITIFSGTQLFVLGIIGEYLARIHFRTMKRPQYIERHNSNNKINVEKKEQSDD